MAAQKLEAVEPTEVEAAAAGLEVFLGKCTQCHTIAPFNVVALENFSGPNLTHFMDRGSHRRQLPRVLPGEPGPWLENPPADKPGSFMPDLGLTQAEIDSLTAFLETLK